MALRPLDDQHRQWLTAELEFWRERQLVDASLGQRILAEYESVADTGQRKRSIARLALMAVAATFVGLAALLIVGYNWSEFSSGFKLVVIFSAVIGGNLLAIVLRYTFRHRGLSEVVFFLSALFFGAAIVLIAEVLHLEGHPPNALWWWALGVIPVALVLETPLLHLLIVGLLATWTGLEIFEYRHRWGWFGDLVPNAALSLPWLLVPGIAWSYRRLSTLGLGSYVALAAWWCVLQAVAWDYERFTIIAVGLIGPLFLILAENHRVGSPLAAPYRLWGALLSGGALIPMSFIEFHRWWWYWWSRAEQEHVALAVAAMVMVWLVVFAASATLLRPLDNQLDAPPLARLQRVIRRQWPPLALAGVMIYVALFVATRPHAQFSGSTVVPGAWAPTLVCNAAMVALALWLIHVGLRDERGRTFAAGVGCIMLWSVMRYFDLFSDVGGVLGAAALFLTCGVVLFGLALWWGRRKGAAHA